MYEEQVAKALMERKITKPIVALIAGLFAERLPWGTTLGHAGAIIEGERGTASAKIRTLQNAGAFIAETPEEVAAILKKLI